MDRLVVPVLMSMLWSWPSTKTIYETDKDSGRSLVEVDGATNKISGENFDYSSLTRGSDIGSWQTFFKVWGF